MSSGWARRQGYPSQPSELSEGGEPYNVKIVAVEYGTGSNKRQSKVNGESKTDPRTWPLLVNRDAEIWIGRSDIVANHEPMSCRCPGRELS
jgi:hypothetical protein